MQRTRREAIRGAVVTLALACGVVQAQPAPEADGGSRRVVIVPVTPAAQPAAEPRIRIVPADPPAQQSGPAGRHIVITPVEPSSPAPTDRHVVIVPAAPQPAGPAADRHIVIVPAEPPAAAPAPERHLVIVPADPAAAPTAPERKIVIVPATPEPSSEAAGSASEPQVGAAAVAPSSAGAPAALNPTDEPEEDTASEPDEASGGDGMRTLTANPDLLPAPERGKVTQPTAGTPAKVAPELAHAAEPPPEPHARLGPFLSGPGSLTFILHHTLMGAAGGFATQGLANDFHSDVGGREALLAGTLVGAGVGFGTSAWWQFNHWVGQPAASFGILNSFSGGMFLTGLLDLTTDDPTALAWSSLVGAELGGWLTVGVGGGDMPIETGLLVASGEGWGAIYGAMLLAIVRFSGSSLPTESAIDTLFITQGAGALMLAFAAGHFHPSATQILRANLSGAIVGGAVLLLSSLVLGHLDSPTPYVLSMASSATTMALVSILWDAGSESSQVSLGGGGSAAYRSVW